MLRVFCIELNEPVGSEWSVALTRKEAARLVLQDHPCLHNGTALGLDPERPAFFAQLARGGALEGSAFWNKRRHVRPAHPRHLAACSPARMDFLRPVSATPSWWPPVCANGGRRSHLLTAHVTDEAAARRTPPIRPGPRRDRRGHCTGTRPDASGDRDRGPGRSGSHLQRRRQATHRLRRRRPRSRRGGAVRRRDRLCRCFRRQLRAGEPLRAGPPQRRRLPGHHLRRRRHVDDPHQQHGPGPPMERGPRT